MQHCVLSVALDTLHFTFIMFIHSFQDARLLRNSSQDVNSEIHKKFKMY